MTLNNSNLAANHAAAAYKAVRRKRYAEAAVLLERAFAIAPSENPAELVLASIASLHLSRFEASADYLERALRQDPLCAPAHGMRLFTRLKSASGPEEAVMACIEEEPWLDKGRIAKLTRRIRKPGEFLLFQKKLLVTDCLDIRDLEISPSARSGNKRTVLKVHSRSRAISSSLRRKILLITLVPVLLVVCGVIVVVADLPQRIVDFAENIRRNTPEKSTAELPETEYFVIDSGRYPAIERYSRQKTPVFYFSEQELLDEMQQARLLMKQGQYNQAVLLLNRMFNSNATLPVREKADFLRNFIRNTEPRQADVVLYGEIAQHPWLYYAYCWKVTGRVENFRQKNNSAVFTLAVKEQNRTEVRGLCDIIADDGYEGISTGADLTIEAIIINPSGSEGRPLLKLVSISD